MAVDFIAQTRAELEARVEAEDDVLRRLVLRTELIEFCDEHPQAVTYTDTPLPPSRFTRYYE